MEKTDDNISINDSYFLFYHMIYETLQTKNVFDGLDKALDLLRIYLNSGDIVLHRKDSDETYRSFTSQALMKTSIDTITCIINKASKLVESKSTLFIDLNLAESLKNIMILHVKTDDNEYILSINNINTKKTLNADFQHNLEDTLNIILKRADIHEKQVIAITEDPLTKLKNRTAYESRIQTLSEIDEE